MILGVSRYANTNPRAHEGVHQLTYRKCFVHMWWVNAKMITQSKLLQFILLDEKFHSYGLSNRDVLMNHLYGPVTGNAQKSFSARGHFFPFWVVRLSGQTHILHHHSKRKRGQRINSPFLPLSLVAFQVWSDLFGQPLVLSELGLSITCSPLCRDEEKIWLSYNYRNKQQAGTRLCNTTCGWLRRGGGAVLLLPFLSWSPSGDNFLPRGFNSEEVLMQQMAAIFWRHSKSFFQ